MAAAAQRATDILGLMRLEDGQCWSQTAAPFQREHSSIVLDPDTPVRQVWVEGPRGSRKTTDCAGWLLAVLYAQAPAGARLYVGASDEDQAAELIDAARGLVDRTPELAGEFTVTDLTITANRTGATVTALPADASAFGKRAYMIILDEVSNWPETRKAKKFWSVLMSGSRKLRDADGQPLCRVVVLSNAGDPAHWSYARRQTARTSPRWRYLQVDGPLPWLTPDDLAALRENSATVSEFEQLHLNRWVASEDRLASPEDIAACTVLPGPLAPEPGIRYLISADLGLVNDRTIVAVMHAADAITGRKVVLDRIERWQGSRPAPVPLGEVRDTIAALHAAYNSAAVVIDPYQAKLLVQELEAAGVPVAEYPFTAASVGRIALSLHQAIRQHRIDLPDDDDLAGELTTVRLRKNSLGTYRLDHDSGQHDDQAVTLALGCYALLDADPEPSFPIFAPVPALAGSVDASGREILEAFGPRFGIRPDPTYTRR